jgi:serine/threonine protein kinase
VCVRVRECVVLFAVVLLLFTFANSVAIAHESMVPVRWASLEVLEPGLYSHASDVWAFGVVLWEIFSGGKTPFGKSCAC